MIEYKNLKGVPDFYCYELSPKTSKYAICIPVINEGNRIINQLEKGINKNINNNFDIIICDGGSTDGSTDLKKLSNLGVNTLIVKNGKGKQGAQLRQGFYFALERSYAGIVTIDGNNKDLLEEVGRFVTKLDEGYDYIQGSRFIKGGYHENTPLMRYFAVKLIHSPIISFTAGNKITDSTNNFRAYSAKYLKDERLNIFRDIFNSYELLAYLSTSAKKLGYRFCEVPVSRIYPRHNVPTKISVFKGNVNLLKILLKNLRGDFKSW
jgi:dolichol-phosphate mannosyltransferase